ncbi:helix-turn-helix transcriptional regulator [Vibrio sp. 10N.222.48.A11]
MANSTINLATQRFFISDKEVRETLGISQPTLWRWTQELGFPKAVKGMRGKRPYKDSLNGRKSEG